MKRILTAIAILICCNCLATAQRIYDSLGYVYEITDDNAKEVSLISLSNKDVEDYKNSTFQDVSIPSFVEYEGEKYSVSALESFYLYPVNIYKKFTFKDKDLSYDNVITNINKLIIPESVRYISSEILKTSNITEITVDSNNKYFSVYDDVLYSKDEKILFKWPKNKQLNNTSRFPITLQTLATGSFRNIEFASIDGLNYLPKTITKWEDNCFINIMNNEEIADFKIPEGIEYVGAGLFYGLAIKINGKVSIPASLKYMSDFHGYDVSKGFDISADNPYFYVVDNSLINRNGSQLCAYWDDLKSIDYCYTLPGSIKSIGRYALSYTKIKSVVINGKDVVLEPYSLVNTDLEKVMLPADMSEIPEGLLQGTKITSLSLPVGVTAIGKSAFAHCINLSTITFNSKLQSIGDKAFESCMALTAVNCNSALREIGDLSFYNCSSLKNISFNSEISSIGFMAFTKSVIEEFVWPASLIDIADYAFYFSALKRISLPESYVNIGKKSFAETRDLCYIKTGNTIEEISGENFASSYVNPNVTEDDVYEWYEGNTFKLEVVLGNNVKNITSPFYSAAYGYIYTAATTPPEIPWANPYNPFRSAIDCIFYTVYVYPDFKEAYIDAWELDYDLDKWPGDLVIKEYKNVDVQQVLPENGELKAVAAYDLWGNSVSKDYRGIVILKSSDGKCRKVVR